MNNIDKVKAIINEWGLSDNEATFLLMTPEERRDVYLPAGKDERAEMTSVLVGLLEDQDFFDHITDQMDSHDFDHSEFMWEVDWNEFFNDFILDKQEICFDMDGGCTNDHGSVAYSDYLNEQLEDYADMQSTYAFAERALW